MIKCTYTTQIDRSKKLMSMPQNRKIDPLDELFIKVDAKKPNTAPPHFDRRALSDKTIPVVGNTESDPHLDDNADPESVKEAVEKIAQPLMLAQLQPKQRKSMMS